EIEACELCGKPMQLKRGRFGPFYGCSGYPECRNIRKISKSGKVNAPPVPIDEKCPLDDAQLVKRQGRFGEFISCSNYPKCKYIKQETTGVKCPRRVVAERSWSRNRDAEKSSMDVPTIRNAKRFIGTNPSKENVRSAASLFCWRRLRGRARRAVVPMKSADTRVICSRLPRLTHQFKRSARDHVRS